MQKLRTLLSFMTMWLVSLPIVAQKNQAVAWTKFSFTSHVHRDQLPDYFSQKPVRQQIFERLQRELNSQLKLTNTPLKEENVSDEPGHFIYEVKTPTEPSIQLEAELSYENRQTNNHLEERIILKMKLDGALGKKIAETSIRIQATDQPYAPYVLHEAQFVRLFQENMAFLLNHPEKRGHQMLVWPRASHPEYQEFSRNASPFLLQQKGSKGFFMSKNQYELTTNEDEEPVIFNLQLGGALFAANKKFLFDKNWVSREYTLEENKQELIFRYHYLERPESEPGSELSTHQNTLHIFEQEKQSAIFCLTEYLKKAHYEQLPPAFKDQDQFSVLMGYYQDNIYHIRYQEEDLLTEIYEDGKLIAVLQESLVNRFHRRRSVNFQGYILQDSPPQDLYRVIRLFMGMGIARHAEIKQVVYGN